MKLMQNAANNCKMPKITEKKRKQGQVWARVRISGLRFFAGLSGCQKRDVRAAEVVFQAGGGFVAGNLRWSYGVRRCGIQVGAGARYGWGCRDMQMGHREMQARSKSGLESKPGREGKGVRNEIDGWNDVQFRLPVERDVQRRILEFVIETDNTGRA